MTLRRLSTGGRLNDINIVDITDVQDVSAAVLSRAVGFSGIIIRTDGVNDITLNVFDNTAASGKRLIPEDVVVEASLRVASIGYFPPVYAENGIYVEVTCSGTYSYQVMYEGG